MGFWVVVPCSDVIGDSTSVDLGASIFRVKMEAEGSKRGIVSVGCSVCNVMSVAESITLIVK
jgi:prefoldin subunit 5